MASWLADAGAPVVAPSDELPAGPHEHDGLVLSFWTYVDEGDRQLDAGEAGRRLLHCHDLLRDFPGELVPLGVLDEADRIFAGLRADDTLDAADAALLRRAGDDVRARIERLALAPQPIHGDAHLHNVINGPDGPLWHDWEDCFLGPRAWDLGCLVATARLFGRDPDPSRRPSPATERRPTTRRSTCSSPLAATRAWRSASSWRASSRRGSAANAATACSRGTASGPDRS